MRVPVRNGQGESLFAEPTHLLLAAMLAACYVLFSRAVILHLEPPRIPEVTVGARYDPLRDYANFVVLQLACETLGTLAAFPQCLAT